MGIIANYYLVDDIRLSTLKKHECFAELYNDEEIEYCDIDKIWQGLHFLLTSREYPEYNQEVQEEYSKDVFVFGEELMSNSEHAFYIPKENIANILEYINKINFEDLNFNPELFKEFDIYPTIWDEDKELLLEELEMGFNELKDFYNHAKEIYKNIVVLIG
ncbi:MAG: DUF1877 family protein [bacterium]